LLQRQGQEWERREVKPQLEAPILRALSQNVDKNRSSDLFKEEEAALLLASKEQTRKIVMVGLNVPRRGRRQEALGISNLDRRQV
jgi:hypothetical protein